MRDSLKAVVLLVCLACGCEPAPKPVPLQTGHLVYYEYGYSTYLGLVLRDEGNQVVLRNIESPWGRYTVDRCDVYGPLTEGQFDIEQSEAQRIEQERLLR